jgi:regulator of protease activity HflC (stomatin/prohibitin superfamily)
MTGLYTILGVIIFLFLTIILPGIFSVGANEVGILTRKMTGKKLPKGRIVAREGENGLQADTLMPGLYWKFWVIWSWRKVKVTVIPPGKVGVIESVDGTPLPPNRILGDQVECNSFQDAKLFLTNGGYRGLQVEILRPGTYRINTKVFIIEIIDATFIDKNKIGVAVAVDGKTLPNGYIIAPEPDNPVPVGQQKLDHKHFQDGQVFINSGGYRGPQLETLQPGEYYINKALFSISVHDVAEVPPGYVAILRSNVGLEVAKSYASSEGMKTERTNKDIENILIQNRDERGIWNTPVIPGKYNLNPIAFTPYLVPTSAVTIDWASEGKIGTEIKGANIAEGVLYKFNPLRVTSMDGFQLDVNVRMVIRIEPENAAWVIARFGSVDNLIDQIVHPLIDSSFRNKAGEKKAIVFFQSRTELQAEALEHAKKTFGEYHVEAQNLLVAYIDIPKQLLDTQTMKEIALQQQSQYQEQARAQEENIVVQEKTARAEKQKDVIAAKLSIDINQDLATAAVKKAEGDKLARILVAEGEASYILQTGNAEGAKQKAIGEGKAAGYEAQVKAMGQNNTALVNVVNNLGDNKTKIVPEILITSGSGELGGISNLVNVLLAKNTKDLMPPESEVKK